MTDNEIIEYLKSNISCAEYVDRFSLDINLDLIKNALNLIISQRKKIERLENEIIEANNIDKEKERIAQKENKENARLFLQTIEYAKSEAIKKFADELKENVHCTDSWGNIVTVECIDDLVREKTEVL